MEKLQDYAKRYGVQAAAISAGLLTGIYAYKIIAGSDPAYGGVDSHFASQNVALHHDEALFRDSALSNVKYELFLALNNRVNYAGKVIITFKYS